MSGLWFHLFDILMSKFWDKALVPSSDGPCNGNASAPNLQDMACSQKEHCL